jgi:ABC-type transporter Mla MlaB component
MLRISINEGTEAVEMKLEGRVAGLWAAEVGRVWVETAPRLAGRTLVLDLRNVIYADSGGTALLSEIYSQTKAKLVADTVWAQSLADQIMRSDAQQANEEL